MKRPPREGEGRPTLYTPELLKKAHQYYDLSVAQEDQYPSLASFALYLDISRETVHTWRNEVDKKEFSDIVEKILALQEARLSEKGLQGEYNASIAKLLLTKHGYTDKADVTSDGKAIKGNTIVLSNFDEE